MAATLRSVVMSDQITEPGSSATVTLRVSSADSAVAFGSGDLEVLATPRIVALVEEAAVTAIAAGVPDGSTSVGTHIDLRHLAPSPMGVEVVGKATVTAVDRRRISFAVEALMADQVVAEGTHVRVVVEREGFGKPA